MLVGQLSSECFWLQGTQGQIQVKFANFTVPHRLLLLLFFKEVALLQASGDRVANFILLKWQFLVNTFAK